MARKRRDHFIPRMLLKRFASRIDGEKQFIWRYGADAPPLELSTKDTGVAKDFYGENDDKLENAFVEFEGAHSSALREIDAGDFDFSKRSPLVADIVWLLALRTEANRLMLTSFVKTAMAEVSKQLPSRRATEFTAQIMEAAYENKLKERPALKALLSLPGMDRHVRDMKYEALSQFRKHFGIFAASFAQDPEIHKTFIASQNEGLSQHLTGGAKCPSAKAPPCWSLVSSEDNLFVLADACVFGIDCFGKTTPVVGGEKLNEIYFPISPRLALVGTFDGLSPRLGPEAIRRHSIAFSSRYVFSHQRCEHLGSEVRNSIGKDAGFLEEEQIEELVSNLWQRPPGP